MAKKFTPSPQQLAVIEWVRHGHGSAFVEAVAGAGKTTTLVEALSETCGEVVFAAFNKAIAEELKVKVGKLGLGNRIRVGTFHSFGFNAWRRAYPKVKVDAYGKSKECLTYLTEELKADARYGAFVGKLVGIAKNSAVGLFQDIDDRSNWYDMVEHFDLSYELDADDGKLSVADGIELAIKALRWHRETGNRIIDFDDMIYLPVVSGLKMYENDWVFVDEAQDSNNARRALARMMLKRNGRSLWVGDRHQAIYGFSGADAASVDNIIREHGCVTLPLTVTYRCPKSVVEVARQVVGHIEAHATAPEGVVQSVDFSEWNKPENLMALTARDAILCRNTRPLVSTAYSLIRQGVACHVEGREIGAGLLKLVNRWKVKSLEKLRERLHDWSETEVTKLMAKGRETQAEAVKDRVETIMVIIDSQPPATTIDELRRRIETMFVDGDRESKPTLTLSTVHKAKGREWPRVFILGRSDYMPSKYARQAWQKQQESNLIYVAVTRAQEKLVLINNHSEKTG